MMKMVKLAKDQVELLSEVVDAERGLLEFYSEDEYQFEEHNLHDEQKKALISFKAGLSLVEHAIRSLVAVNFATTEENPDYVIPAQYAEQLVAVENNYLASKVLLVRNHNISTSIH